MKDRRQFLKTTFGVLIGLGVWLHPVFDGIRKAFGKAKTILSGNTTRESLINKDPATLDTRNLKLTNLEDFETMGLSDHEVDLDRWRFVVTGLVQSPLHLSLSEIRALPSIERKVLLICPGFFANHGNWKGISMGALLEKAGAAKDATHVVFSGPEGESEKNERFPLADILSDKVFLAYAVNGEILPRKHGFPLRLVAEDYYGSVWVKYVYKVNVVNT